MGECGIKAPMTADETETFYTTVMRTIFNRDLMDNQDTRIFPRMKRLMRQGDAKAATEKELKMLESIADIYYPHLAWELIFKETRNAPPEYREANMVPRVCQFIWHDLCEYLAATERALNEIDGVRYDKLKAKPFEDKEFCKRVKELIQSYKEDTVEDCQDEMETRLEAFQNIIQNFHGSESQEKALAGSILSFLKQKFMGPSAWPLEDKKGYKIFRKSAEQPLTPFLRDTDPSNPEGTALEDTPNPDPTEDDLRYMHVLG